LYAAHLGQELTGTFFI
jgi:hypothetical protein